MFSVSAICSALHSFFCFCSHSTKSESEPQCHPHHDVRIANDSPVVSSTSSLDRPPSPCEPQNDTSLSYIANHAHLLPSSFSDPSFFRLPYSTLTFGPTFIPVAAEETVSEPAPSYQEILGMGQHRIAEYEAWCDATSHGQILESYDPEQLEQAYCFVSDADDFLSLQIAMIEILLAKGLYKFQARLSQHVTSTSELANSELQLLKHQREQLISRRLLLQTVPQATRRIAEHPNSRNIDFFNLRLLPPIRKPTNIGPLENDQLFYQGQLFLEDNNISRLREAVKVFVEDADALMDGRLRFPALRAPG